MFAEPFHTPYDLRFNLFGFPIRIQALFWLAAILFGTMSGERDPGTILLLILVLFVSLMVHELGHAFAMRRFGMRAHVVLYWLGGLAIPGSPTSNAWDVSSYEQPRRRSPWEQIAISFAGPAAGFAFAGLIILVIIVSGGKFELLPLEFVVRILRAGHLPVFWDADLPLDPDKYRNVYSAVHNLLFFNIFWGLVNLMPVFPLDGGQISRKIFNMADPWGGLAKSLMTSMVVAILLGILGFTSRNTFMGFMFLSLAFSSYQAWQQVQNNSRRPW